MAFLEKDELRDALLSAQKYQKNFVEPFSEYERIAANLPSDLLPPSYPRVTDGTLAALLAETPMQTWGQLQTGRMVPLTIGQKNYEKWKIEMVNALWTNRLVPNMNIDYPLFVKLWLALYNSLIYGSQPAYSFMVSNDLYTGADFKLPSVRDVLYEPTKTTDRACNYIWLYQYYTKLELKSIMEIAKQDKKGITGWNLKALAEIYDSNPFKEQSSNSLTNEQRNYTDFGKTVRFATCFHRGHNSPFYTIYSQSTANDAASLDVDKDNLIRTQYNGQVNGDIPITTMYHQYSMSNPYGRGQVELAGPTQNLIDFFVAAHALITMIGLEPPTKIRGQMQNTGLDLSSIVYEPRAQWLIGDGEVDVVNPANAIYSQLVNYISMYKTNVQNLQGTSDGSISASDSGNSLYSKTPAGIKLQENRTGSKQNYLRQRIDDFIGELAPKLINLTLNKLTGSEVMEISDQQANKLLAAGYDMPKGKREVTIEFDELKKQQFKFDVDPGSSILKNDDDTKDRLVEITKILLEVPNLEQIMANEDARINIGLLIRQIVSKSGIDDWEKIITDLTPEDKKRIQMVQSAAQGQNANVAQSSAPQIAQQTTEQTDMSDDEVLVEQLRSNGWSDEQIKAYMEREVSV